MDQNSPSDTGAGNPVWIEVLDEHADHGITVEPHGVERGDTRVCFKRNPPLYVV